MSEVDYQEVRRGMVAGPPDCFEAASLFEARLQTLPGRAGPLKHRAWVRVHVGTAGTLEQILFGPGHTADGTLNLIGALKRAMATTGYSDLKEFQRIEVVVSPYNRS